MRAAEKSGPKSSPGHIERTDKGAAFPIVLPQRWLKTLEREPSAAVLRMAMWVLAIDAHQKGSTIRVPIKVMKARGMSARTGERALAQLVKLGLLHPTQTGTGRLPAYLVIK